MEFNDVLKELIDSKGIKQKFIAEKLQINENKLSQILNGKREISLKELYKALILIGVDFNTYFELVKQKKESQQ